MACALSGKADESLGCDSPQKLGGAEAEVWHGADGHPLIEEYPMNGREGLANCGSWSMVSSGYHRIVEAK